MTAFGGVFRSPALEGVEKGEGSGERARFVGLDLESGVVRVRASRPDADAAGGGAVDDEDPEATDPA